MRPNRTREGSAGSPHGTIRTEGAVTATFGSTGTLAQLRDRCGRHILTLNIELVPFSFGKVTPSSHDNMESGRIH